MTKVYVMGILDDGWGGLSDEARTALTASTLVIGVRRTLDLIRVFLPQAELREMDGALAQVTGWIKETLAQERMVTLLATGDPLCYGMASYLLKTMDKKDIRILPAPSTMQIACARFHQSWDDVVLASCHSKDAGEWYGGAAPGHGLYSVMRAIDLNRRVFVFTSPDNDPARLARALMMSGRDHEITLFVACRLQRPDEQIFAQLTLREAADMHFPEPNVMLVESVRDISEPVMGLSDHEFIQRYPEKGLITKQELRMLSLAKLRLHERAIIWDIGAGSGSVGLECARIARHGHVWAMEKNEVDAANALANAKNLRVGNYTLVHGKAPQGLDAWPNPDAVFIGGSGGELGELIHLSLIRMNPGGRLVMNFVTLENLSTALARLKALAVAWDVVQLQASRSQPILDMCRLAAQNPVWVVTAWNDGVSVGEDIP